MSQATIIMRSHAWHILARNKLYLLSIFVLILLLLIAALGSIIVPFNPQQVGTAPRFLPPGSTHWMGTDDLGRDVFSRVVIGLRISLIVGLSAAILSALIGVIVGAAAGFFGGLLDVLLMRLAEVFMVIPRFFLALVLVALFGANVLNVIFAISLLTWPMHARLVRAEFLSLKSRQFVEAARVAGASTSTLVFVEILPNVMGPVIVAATLRVGQAIVIEAGLSYLGLGDPSNVSLGLMLQQAQSVMRLAWWTAVFPGLMIFLAVLSLNLLGDALNDLFDPRSKLR